MAVEVTLVWQLVEAAASAYKACKIGRFVGLKKRNVTAIVCVFYEKRRLKIRCIFHLGFIVIVREVVNINF